MSIKSAILDPPKPRRFEVAWDTADKDSDADPAESWAYEECAFARQARARAEKLRQAGHCTQIFERINFQMGRFGWDYDRKLVWEDGTHADSRLGE